MKSILYAVLALAIVFGAVSAHADKPSNAEGLKRVKQVMVKPPLLPKHDQVAKGGPKIVEVRLVIEEKEIEASLA